MKPHVIDNIILLVVLNLIVFFLLSLAWGGMAWPFGGVAEDGQYYVHGIYEAPRTVSQTKYTISRFHGMLTAGTGLLAVVLLAVKRFQRTPGDS